MTDNIIITNLAPVPDRVPLYADDIQIKPLHPQWRRFFNDMRDRVGAASGSIIYDANNNSTALVTLSGVAANSTDLGTFTGTLIPNSSTIKAALQSLETPLDSALVDITDLVTLSGVGANSTNLGTFTGTIISDSSTIKVALQELESYSATAAGTVTSVAALTLGTIGTDLSSSVATSTTTPVITLNVPSASALNRGALLAADWITFDNKQAALVSGTNIKTVNGSTLLGSGDVGTIDIAHGGTSLTSIPTNGQLLIGNGTNYTLATLTAGTGIGLTNGSGAITIATTLTITQVGFGDGSNAMTSSSDLTYASSTLNINSAAGTAQVQFKRASANSGAVYDNGTVVALDTGPTTATVSLRINGSSILYGTASTLTFNAAMSTSFTLTSTSRASFTAAAPTNVMYLKGTGAVGTSILNVELDDSGGTKPAVRITNLTNFAQAGSFVTITSANGSDSGALLVLTNAGTGNYITAGTNFTVSKAGKLYAASTVATGSGATGSRPTATVEGEMWYDTTLNKPIFWDNGSSLWRDAAGTSV